MSDSAEQTSEISDADAALARLRADGAGQFDAVGWHFVQRLAERAARPGPARTALLARLACALQAFQQRFDSAQSQARAALDAAVAAHPGGAAELQKLLASGQFSALLQRIAEQHRATAPSALSALNTLVQELNHQAPEAARPVGTAPKKPTPNLNTPRPDNPRIGQFRNTLSKISVAKQVTLALTQAPQNAGPINSHMLVLRSLALMRDASPDYLNRFMAYADTLLRLDEAQYATVAPKKAAGAGKSKTNQTNKSV